MEAIFLNGVYKSALDEIIEAIQNNKNLVCYLQPYKSSEIKLLKNNPPSEEKPVRLYISITSNLNIVAYCADIVQWEDKRDIDPQRLSLLNGHIKEYQPNIQTVETRPSHALI